MNEKTERIRITKLFNYNVWQFKAKYGRIFPKFFDGHIGWKQAFGEFCIALNNSLKPQEDLNIIKTRYSKIYEKKVHHIDLVSIDELDSIVIRLNMNSIMEQSIRGTANLVISNLINKLDNFT